MTTDRPYRDAMPYEAAAEILRTAPAASGTPPSSACSSKPWNYSAIRDRARLTSGPAGGIEGRHHHFHNGDDNGDGNGKGPIDELVLPDHALEQN